jgi:hypothetical protein
MGGQQQTMRRAAGSQQLFAFRDFRVRLRTGDHHDQHRRTQRHVARLLQRFVRGIGLPGLQSVGKQLTELAARIALDGQEAPGVQLAVIRRTQGCTKKQIELIGIGCRLA